MPDNYKFYRPSVNDMNIASIAWGFSLGVCIFTGAKGAKQTVKSWKRGTRTNIYLILLWTEWASSTIMSAITWSYLREYIKPGFAVFFVIGMVPYHAWLTGGAFLTVDDSLSLGRSDSNSPADHHQPNLDPNGGTAECVEAQAERLPDPPVHQHQRLLRLDTCPITDQPKVEGYQQHLGSNREGHLLADRCGPQLLLYPSGPISTHRQRPHQVQPTLPIQLANDWCLHDHGCTCWTLASYHVPLD